MPKNKSFPPGWEPTLIGKKRLAQGYWWYDDMVQHDAVLVEERFDYSSDDLEQLERDLHPIHMDYIDFAINEEGFRYVWYFDGPNGKSQSKSLSSIADAKEHIQSYGRTEIMWLRGDSSEFR